jgi:glycosyltransferase involved in cell wall biosynthesis
MSDYPQFTVVIPAYNAGGFLAETLQSVLAQTYPPAEIIVVDDGSKDNTAEVAESFGERVRLIRQVNAGVSASRNAGTAAASTEWVSFLDADDLWLPNHLLAHAAALAADPAADFCYSTYRTIRRSEGETAWIPGPAVIPPAPEVFAQAVMDRCLIIPSITSMRRSTLLDMGGFDGRFNAVEDWDCWIRLSRRGARVVRVIELTSQYRIHPSQATGDPFANFERIAYVLNNSILPNLPRWRRIPRKIRMMSRFEGEVAIMLRERGRPGAAAMMIRSILHHPFHEARRYKILAHLLLKGYPQAAPLPEKSRAAS